MSAQHTPGPWFVSPDSATGGFVVCRKRNAPPSWHPYETLKASDGREACFWTEADAHAAISFTAAIAKATGSAA